MTIKKNVGTFRDGTAESMRRSVSTRKFADSVKSTTDGLDSRLSGLDTRLSGLEIYTPANAAHWNNDPPDTIQEALDRIAKKITPVPV